tara:strand:- start:146 stop:412 length:267 start_codon:yes stop_codon:yes gene_type:complete
LANTGKRLKNLSYEDGTETTNESGIYTATLSGNYSGRPFVSVQATGANYNAFVKTVTPTATGWQVVFGTSTGEAGFKYQVWGEIIENF